MGVAGTRHDPVRRTRRAAMATRTLRPGRWCDRPTRLRRSCQGLWREPTWCRRVRGGAARCGRRDRPWRPKSGRAPLGGDVPVGRRRRRMPSLSGPFRSRMPPPGPSLLLRPLAVRARHISLAVTVQRPPLSHAPVSGVTSLLPNRLEEGRFSRNPVSFAVVRGSAHHRESLTPLGLPFSDGAFVAWAAPSGTTPDTRQPAPRLHHFRT